MIEKDFIYSKIKQNKFLIIGRAGVDIYPDPPGVKIENAKKYVTYLGGSSANIAVAISKLGGKCDIFTTVPDDALGNYALNQLNNYGVGTKLIKRIKGESKISFAVVETTNIDHQSIIYRNNASDFFVEKEDVDKINFNDYSCIINAGTSLSSEPSRTSTLEAFKIAKKNQLLIIMDIDFRPYVWENKKVTSNVYREAIEYCDIIVGNENEFGIICNEPENSLEFAKNLSKDSKMVIYKMGSKGSITFFNKEIIKKGIFKVNALKPTGAGDAFMGGFIGSIISGEDIENSIIFGSASAALVVTKVGCSEAMPDILELKNFMNNNNISFFEGE